MSEKKIPKISSRQFSFVTGLIFSLLSIVLIINVGPVARAINFPFVYLFGAGQLLIFLFVYYIGMCLIIKGHVILSKNPFFIIGLIITFFGCLILTTEIVTFVNPDIVIGQDFFNQYQNIYSDIGIYFNAKFFHFFAKETPVGGGLLGYTLHGLLVSGGGMNLSMCVAIPVTAVGILFCFEPLILKLIIKISKNHSNKKTLEEPAYKKQTKKEKDDFFASAATIDEETIREANEARNIPGENITVPNFNERDSLPEFSQVDISGDSFAKAKFEVDDLMFANTEIQDQPSEEIFEKKEIIASDVEETVEQMALPFENELVEEIKEEPVKEDKIDDVPATQVFETEEFVKDTKVIEPVVEEIKEEIEEPFIWVPPSLDLLDEYPAASAMEINQATAEERKNMINEIFKDFNLGAECIGYTIGSSVTRYHIQYGNNVSSSRVAGLVQDISIRLGGLTARFEGVIEGEFYSGLEIANPKTSMVSFKEIVSQLPDVNEHPTSVGFGKDISGKVVAADFAEFPHLLVAGTTGSGKSIYIHSVIATLIMRMSPEQLRIILVDPKRVEMTKYRDMPHLLCPIITEADKATVMMNKLADEMNYRYSQFEIADSCSDIKQYNEWAEENKKPKMPYILAVLDEYADLVDTAKDISKPVVSIAQKARAAGILLLISTQRPSTNVITGTIKANLATRVALMTANAVDSMTIIGEGGAEKLLGKGDMLVQSALVSRVGFVRLQGCFVNNKEIGRVVNYLKDHYKTKYDDAFLDLVDHSKEAASQSTAYDPDYAIDGLSEEEAAYQSIKEWTMCQTSVSISKIQRECSVGFNRAGRFLFRMQEEGIVSYEKDPNTKGCLVLKIDKFSEAGRNVSSSEVTSIGSDEDK